MSKTIERPEIVRDEHLDYLDDLRESGETNMFGAARYLVGHFNVPYQDAKAILSYWMETFGRSFR